MKEVVDPLPTNPLSVGQNLDDQSLPQHSNWMVAFGKRFRAARLKAELTQEYVSSQLRGSTGEGQAYISKIERGQINLTSKSMIQLAHIVGQDPNRLIIPIPPRIKIPSEHQPLVRVAKPP